MFTAFIRSLVRTYKTKQKNRVEPQNTKYEDFFLGIFLYYLLATLLLFVSQCRGFCYRAVGWLLAGWENIGMGVPREGGGGGSGEE